MIVDHFAHDRDGLNLLLTPCSTLTLAKSMDIEVPGGQNLALLQQADWATWLKIVKATGIALDL